MEGIYYLTDKIKVSIPIVQINEEYKKILLDTLIESWNLKIETKLRYNGEDRCAEGKFEYITNDFKISIINVKFDNSDMIRWGYRIVSDFKDFEVI